MKQHNIPLKGGRYDGFALFTLVGREAPVEIVIDGWKYSVRSVETQKLEAISKEQLDEGMKPS